MFLVLSFKEHTLWKSRLFLVEGQSQHANFCSFRNVSTALRPAPAKFGALFPGRCTKQFENREIKIPANDIHFFNVDVIKCRQIG